MKARSAEARDRGRAPAGDREDPGRSAGLRALVKAARQSAGRAYAPYSRFAVGAALESGSGLITVGFNVENAAYPLGICAERAALLQWRITGGDPIVRLVIHTETAEPTTPCGLCRDALLRWAPAAELYLSSRQGLLGPYRIGDWLPAGHREGA